MGNNYKFLKLCLFLFLFGCSSSRSGGVMVRTAEGFPARFDTPAGTEWGGTSCKNPIIDPTDGTELVLVQSRAGFGDYSVQNGKYGIQIGELLRINCTTGEVIGIVRR